MSDEPIFSAKAGLFIRSAKLSKPVRSFNAWGTWGTLGLSLWITRKINGGYWTGGEVKLYNDKIILSANDFNAAFFDSPPIFDVPLSDIARTGWREGMRTGIIDIFSRSSAIPISFRCEDSKEVLAKIDAAIVAI